MKYKGIKQKKEQASREWVIQVAAAATLVALPFVVSFVGWDTFRFPKDAFLFLATVFLTTLLVAFRRLSIRSHFSVWEWILLGGIVYVAVHTLGSSNPELSWSGLKSLLIFSLFFWVLKSISKNRFQKRVWLWVGAAMGVNAVLTVLQFYGKFDWMRSATGRAIRGRVNPAGFIGEVNSGGFLFGLVIIVLVYYVATRQRLAIRIVAAVLICLNLVGLAFARGLTASLGLGVCLLLWVVFHHWRVLRQGKGVSRELVVFWMVLVVAFVGGLGVSHQAGVTQRLGRVLKATQEGSWNLATAGRIPVYWLTWQMIKEEPWLGRGLNTFGKDFFHFRAETEAGQSVHLLQQSGAFREAHNEYLQVWEELGFPGLLIFLALLFSPVVITFKRFREEADAEDSYWLGILTIGLVFVGISCLAFFPLHLSVTSAYIALLLAGIRAVQDPPSDSGAIERSLLRPVLVGVLICAVAAFAWQAISDWRANNEAGIASFLVRRAGSRDFSPVQKRTIADEALARVERVESLAPEMREIHSLKGSVLMMLGRYEQAAESYLKGVEYVPSPELYTNLAAAYLALEKKRQAKECLDLALGYSPGYRKARQARRFLANGR